MPALIAAIYARYSSRLQRPTSIDDQIRLCHDAAARFNCTISPEHVYTDREITGSEAGRPGYQRLLAAARHRAFDAIIVEAQDRLWRNQAEMHHALRRLTFWKVKVFAVNSGHDLTDHSGRVVATVFGLKDELYLDDLREKTHRGLAGQARRGFHAGGRTYGYRTDPVPDPGRHDAHGQALIAGYRRAIVPGEAAVVVRIFEQYASGHSPKRIVRALNEDRIPPPRGVRGWTWTAIYGTPRLGTGILRNPLYIGDLIWNKFRWEKNPDTGTRVPRLRPRDEWIIQHDESLRIIPQDLWDRVHARGREVSRRSRFQPHSGGRPPSYLFSGLLICGPCGAHYIIRSGGYYACSFHLNRGPKVCANALGVSRHRLEDRLLRVIRDELFSPEAIAYLTQRVNDALRAHAAVHHARSADRRALEAQLRAALAELDHIRDAIPRGMIGDLTREMVEETEARVRDLRAKLAAPTHAALHALQLLPEAIARRLAQLDRLLLTNADEAKTALRQLLGPVILQPTPEGLVAELRGNIEGLLALTGEQALVVGNTGSGGWI
jgi:site-specific DNA recombinase